ncbi:MAG: 23S rRNA pseudouridine2457 synthase [Thiomicrorhabdus sp.]|nr:MAG: 23S rRNA pseudouridine2457 synthase [Thiomicrorhabdus sp.]
MSHLLLFNKPFNVLCQFTDDAEQALERETLAKYIDQKGFYAAGRLDRDSEGLLLLTDDGKLQHQISDPLHKLPKTYWVQVEGDVTKEVIALLKQGVELKDGLTRPALAKKMIEPKWLWQRNPPIRQRENIPTSWIELTITEGKNRQVRRMTAAVGFPTLRLVRAKIGDWTLQGLGPGESKLLYDQKIPAHFITQDDKSAAPQKGRKPRSRTEQKPSQSGKSKAANPAKQPKERTAGRATAKRSSKRVPSRHKNKS